MIDIDDIFVGKDRMTTGDVQALLASQNTLSKLIPGFRYNLGFSGGSFKLKSSTEEEKKADSLLIENRHQFWWFPHMWTHLQPHIFTDANYVDKSHYMTLEEHMDRNKEFAIKHDIPTDNQYSVSPHHSGVYPVHQLLYEVCSYFFPFIAKSSDKIKLYF